MSPYVAALPMYDWPEVRAEVDAEWADIRDGLRRAGIDAPERLARCNADMPAVPGGIRDADGLVIAPDPATLPPDELDLHTLWRHPRLLFAQTCWGPMERGLREHVRVVGQPSYDAYEGGEGELYSSALVMRRETRPSSPCRDLLPAGGEKEEAATLRSSPFSPSASLPLALLRGKRLAYNGPDSMSGILALTRDLEAAGEGLAIFSGMVETGSHRASAIAVAKGRADVAALDCRSWDLVRRFEPAARALEVVGWTTKRKGLPFIASPSAPRFALPV